MTEDDVSGLDMDLAFLQPTRATLERDVPVVRLEKDVELREIYEFGRKLGQGNFGVVYEATHIETRTNWAIKEVCKPAAGSSKVRMIGREINILKQVNHAHIIHLKEVYDTPKMIYLVTELCTGGELNQLLWQKKFFPEDETRHIINSLADAVAYLHKRDIIHRDLKLENILVKNCPDEDDNTCIDIKVIDFGLSVQTGGVGIANIMTEACGTLTYMAPEMMSGRGYSQWCDVWSIGVIMYMLLCGKPPFASRTKTRLLEEITSRGVTFTDPIWSVISDTAKNVLTCLLNADPAYRMSANQLLENPWITGNTNMPAVPSNVLDMMCNHLEEEGRAQTLEDLSLTSFEDTADLTLVPRAATTKTDNNCRSSAKLNPVRDSSLRMLHTPTKLTKDGGSSLQQNKDGPDTSSQPTTSQSHACVKHIVKPCGKQRKSQNKKDLSTRQKPSPELKNIHKEKRRLFWISLHNTKESNRDFLFFCSDLSIPKTPDMQ